MTTYTATRADSTFPVFKGEGSGALCCAWGTIEVTTNPSASDIFEMCRIPAGSTIVGGWIWSDDLDTNATETLDIDIGWAANGVEVADPDGLGNLGVFTTDTVAGVKPEAGYNFPLGGTLITDGPRSFTRETVIQVTVVATAATFAAGTLSVAIYYVCP